VRNKFFIQNRRQSEEYRESEQSSQNLSRNKKGQHSSVAAVGDCSTYHRLPRCLGTISKYMINIRDDSSRDLINQSGQVQGALKTNQVRFD
jgi:hypothetical protein